MVTPPSSDPIIFRGLKSLTLDDPQQQSLLRLALEGISVYCPHTAVDAVPDGMADWLCDIVTGRLSEPEPEPATHKASQPSTPLTDQPSEDPFISPPKPTHPNLPHRQYSKPTYPILATPLQTSHLPTTTTHLRQTIHPHKDPLPDFLSSGFGRLITFTNPQPLTSLIERIARGVGNPAGFPVAIPQGLHVEDLSIKTVGICPGSGASVLRDCPTHLDLIFTGELSHHEALAAIERGTAVVTLFHSNTERGYLHQIMKGKLEATIKEEWKRVREETEKEGLDEDWEDALRDEGVSVQVSERDRDPFGIVILEGHGAGEGTKLGGTR
jgi:putative NIF3 family GTP cyclohydrolase 1 type 2